MLRAYRKRIDEKEAELFMKRSRSRDISSAMSKKSRYSDEILNLLTNVRRSFSAKRKKSDGKAPTTGR